MSGCGWPLTFWGPTPITRRRVVTRQFDGEREAKQSSSIWRSSSYIQTSSAQLLRLLMLINNEGICVPSTQRQVLSVWDPPRCFRCSNGINDGFGSNAVRREENVRMSLPHKQEINLQVCEPRRSELLLSGRGCGHRAACRSFSLLRNDFASPQPRVHTCTHTHTRFCVNWSCTFVFVTTHKVQESNTHVCLLWFGAEICTWICILFWIKTCKDNKCWPKQKQPQIWECFIVIIFWEIIQQHL